MDHDYSPDSDQFYCDLNQLTSMDLLPVDIGVTDVRMELFGLDSQLCQNLSWCTREDKEQR